MYLFLLQPYQEEKKKKHKMFEKQQQQQQIETKYYSSRLDWIV